MIKGKHLYGFYKLLDRFRCICRISWIIYTWLNTIIFEVSDVLVNNKRKSKPPKTKNIGKKKRSPKTILFLFMVRSYLYASLYFSFAFLKMTNPDTTDKIPPTADKKIFISSPVYGKTFILPSLPLLLHFR